MRHNTKRARIVIAALSIFGLGLTSFPAAQAEPKVTVEDVENAFHKVEATNEQVNQLGEDIKAANSQIATLNADIARDTKLYETQKEELSAAIVQQQLDAPLGPTVNLLASQNPTEFLDGLGAIQALNSTRADALENFGKTNKELKNRKAQLKDRQADLVASKKQSQKKQEEIRAGYEDAKAELARLTATEQAAFNQSNTTLDFEVDASGRAGKALDFALAQLGDPYVWGGTGPDGWDCSGLTQAAYGAAGVSIGRVTYDQAKAGRAVSMGSLAPGDLVFYGNMQHMGMYVGKGSVVHSPRPGKQVEITGLGGFSQARRIVG